VADEYVQRRRERRLPPGAIDEQFSHAQFDAVTAAIEI
jgi:hypothetical protein